MRGEASGTMAEEEVQLNAFSASLSYPAFTPASGSQVISGKMTEVLLRTILSVHTHPSTDMWRQCSDTKDCLKSCI